jgi:hypothetical protein
MVLLDQNQPALLTRPRLTEESVRSPKAKELEDCNDHDDQTDDVNYLVHIFSFPLFDKLILNRRTFRFGKFFKIRQHLSEVSSVTCFPSNKCQDCIISARIYGNSSGEHHGRCSSLI